MAVAPEYMGTISSVCVNSVTLFVLEDVHFLWRVDKCTCLWRIQISRQDDWCDWIQDDHVMSLCEDTARRCCRGVNRKWKTRAGGVGGASFLFLKGGRLSSVTHNNNPVSLLHGRRSWWLDESHWLRQKQPQPTPGPGATSGPRFLHHQACDSCQ